jgi:hypothetical protein
MTSTNEKGLSADRIQNSATVKMNYVQCPICHNILWNPIACQMCEKSYCSTCLRKWFNAQPGKCPNRCQKFVERKCLGIMVQLLAEIQLACIYKPTGCCEVTWLIISVFLLNASLYRSFLTRPLKSIRLSAGLSLKSVPGA